MNPFTKYLTMGGAALLAASLWLASAQGWGLSNLSNAGKLSDREVQNCPEYRKDRFGNCPPKSHRYRLGRRSFYDGGGK